MNNRTLSLALLAATFLLASAFVQAPKPDELPPSSPALMQPDALVKALQANPKPTVLYVGPRFLYAQEHITGAEFIGPASDPQSLERLRKRATTLGKKAAIVLYCGCCPWEHCPNIRPAYKELHALGFTNVKALYLPTSFGTDWVEKKFPTEKGEAGGMK